MTKNWCLYRSEFRSSICRSSCNFSVSVLPPTLAPGEGRAPSPMMIVPVTMRAEGAADEHARVAVIGRVIWVIIGVAVMRVIRWRRIIAPAYRRTDTKSYKHSCVRRAGWHRQGANTQHGYEDNRSP